MRALLRLNTNAPPLPGPSVTLTHALWTGSAKKTWAIWERLSQGCRVSFKTHHLNQLSSFSLWEYWSNPEWHSYGVNYNTPLPHNDSAKACAFHQWVSIASIHNQNMCVCEHKMRSGLQWAYSQYIVSAGMTFPSLLPFQGAVWKIGRRGTEDKGRPAILLGASPRLLWRQNLATHNSQRILKC